MANLLGQRIVERVRKKRARASKGKKRRPSVLDDLAKRASTAEAPNQLWPGDMTEHWTDEREGERLRAQDVYAIRIGGYSIRTRE